MAEHMLMRGMDLAVQEDLVVELVIMAQAIPY